MNARWPAVAFQSIFLGANSAFLFTAAGKDSTSTGCFIASMAVILVLFIIQTVSKDQRLMYLFPVAEFKVIQGNRRIIKRAKAHAYDTYILKGLLLTIYLPFLCRGNKIMGMDFGAAGCRSRISLGGKAFRQKK